MSGAAESDVPTDSTTNNASGITTSSLKLTLTEKLEAEHVDVEDISGKTKLFAVYSHHGQKHTLRIIYCTILLLVCSI